MTSLELVYFLNSVKVQEGGKPDLTPANFMAKVPKVLTSKVVTGGLNCE